MSLPQGYKIRPPAPDDYGMLDVLGVLTTVGTVPRAEFGRLVMHWHRTNEVYRPLVIVDAEERVAACGMLVLERKLIHSLGVVGHIEDIAVRADQQGLKLGKHLIEALTADAKAQGCYKVILDCDESNVGFYEKCGYSRAGVEMSIRFDK